MKRKSAEQIATELKAAQKKMERSDPIDQEIPSILKRHISDLVNDEEDRQVLVNRIYALMRYVIGEGICGYIEAMSDSYCRSEDDARRLTGDICRMWLPEKSRKEVQAKTG